MRSIKRILVPIDFSSGARAALELAALLGEKLDASIDAIHVWQPPASASPGALVSVPGLANRPITELARGEAERELAFFMTLEKPDGPPIPARLEEGDPAPVILRVARDGDYQLIVMGTTGRTGLRHAVLGSVAERVVRHAHCGVLMARGQEEVGR
ncbi:MAG: universal stress protein [Acidobacteriota bacterium]